jgi:cytochrome c1
MKKLTCLLLLPVIFFIAGFIFILSGIYNMGADSPHGKPTAIVLERFRDRAIAHHARDIMVPVNLDDPEIIMKGAGQYAAMCTSCHLVPGMKNSELRAGLYPLPPDLTQEKIDPRVAFWVIKHGIKMSAMPAWGGSHDDATIWSMVAFLRKLPDMTPETYQAIVAKAPPDEDMDADMPADMKNKSHEHLH